MVKGKKLSSMAKRRVISQKRKGTSENTLGKGGSETKRGGFYISAKKGARNHRMGCWTKDHFSQYRKYEGKMGGKKDMRYPDYTAFVVLTQNAEGKVGGQQGKGVGRGRYGRGSHLRNIRMSLRDQSWGGERNLPGLTAPPGSGRIPALWGGKGEESHWGGEKGIVIPENRRRPSFSKGHLSVKKKKGTRPKASGGWKENLRELRGNSRGRTGGTSARWAVSSREESVHQR